MSLYGKFYFRPKDGEVLYTELMPVVKNESAIVGVVKMSETELVSDATVVLFSLENANSSPKFISQTKTDKDGHFCFGELSGEVLYQIKVFKEGSLSRYLEIPLD